MTNPKWKIGPVRLVSGDPATIRCFCKQRHCYIGERTAHDGAVYAMEWAEDGSRLVPGVGDTLNLAPPPKSTVRVKGWINVYANGSAGFWKEKYNADAQTNRFACIEIEREVEEGEGL